MCIRDRDVVERVGPRDRLPLVALADHRHRQPLGGVERLVREAVAVGEPALVDVFVLERQDADHLRALDLDDQVGAGRIMRADALATRELPGARAVAERLRGDRADRAEVDHVARQLGVDRVAGDTVDSELSGNMIDLCPVGAITSKPFRYSARAWELSRRKGVSPHDSTGANLIVQVKGAQVVRVLPLENEDVNECWLADRDRFSYEALNTAERLTVPMIRQGNEWKTVSWTDALDYVSRGLTQIAVEHGPQSIGALGTPLASVEELHLLAKLVRGLGSDNIDTRLRETAAPG